MLAARADDGAALRDTRARARTGVSVVAVVPRDNVRVVANEQKLKVVDA